MRFERFVARRQVQAIRRRRRVAFTARIASFGVGVGVAASIVVLSVMNGFSGLLWERLLTLNPHLVIRHSGYETVEPSDRVIQALSSNEAVVGVAPFLASQGFLMRRGVGGTYQAGGRVLALETEGLMATSELGRFLWAGELDLDPQEGDGRVRYGIVLGSYLADRLGASVGQEVRLAFPPQEIGTGRTPPVRRYVVTGLFSTGYAEFDNGLALISLDAARRDLQPDGTIDGYRVRLADPLQAASFARTLEGELRGDLVASPWMREHGSLYASIQLEKWSFYVGLTLIVIIAGFNIISIVSMNVAEQRKEIGILKAMGTPPSSITRIYALSGFRIGLTGVVGGAAIGILVCAVQIVFEPLHLPGDVFIVNALPVELRAFDVAVTALVALALSFAFAVLPARSAASVEVVETLRS